MKVRTGPLFFVVVSIALADAISLSVKGFDVNVDATVRNRRNERRISVENEFAHCLSSSVLIADVANASRQRGKQANDSRDDHD